MTTSLNKNESQTGLTLCYHVMHTYLYLARVGLTPLGTGRIGPVSGCPAKTSLASGKGGRSCWPSASLSCNDRLRKCLCVHTHKPSFSFFFFWPYPMGVRSKFFFPFLTFFLENELYSLPTLGAPLTHGSVALCMQSDSRDFTPDRSWPGSFFKDKMEIEMAPD